ncbi:MAG: Gfo/Idh/MocA family oxidoreductase [Candidatus Hydrogenedentes bacterium]|nr:Gfo/Idh/MocA family oxidoreductase [Candidatus Hydrogenedentota bacterium]
MNRRAFLTAAAAGLAASRARAAGPVRRVAVAGCGARGAALLDALDALRRAGFPVETALVCDADPARARAAARRHGARIASSWEAAADPSRADAVVVALPDAAHAPTALAALSASLPVYLETPLCAAPEDTERLAAWAARPGAPAVQVGAAALLSPGWRLAAEVLASGRLGRVAWCQSAARCLPADGWRARRADSLGPAAQAHFDQLAPLLALLGLGAPARVCSASGIWHLVSETPDALMTAFHFAGGVEIHLASGPWVSRNRSVMLRGDRAALELFPDRVRLLPQTGAEEELSAPPAVLSPAALLLADWLDAAATGRAPQCPLSTGLAAQYAVAAAAAPAAPSGCVV